MQDEHPAADGDLLAWSWRSFLSDVLSIVHSWLGPAGTGYRGGRPVVSGGWRRGVGERAAIAGQEEGVTTTGQKGIERVNEWTAGSARVQGSRGFRRA